MSKMFATFRQRTQMPQQRVCMEPLVLYNLQANTGKETQEKNDAKWSGILQHG